MSALANFIKKSNKPEVYPIVGILGFALSGAAFFGARAVKSPDVCWNHRENPHPWQEIKEGEQVKLMAFNQKYEGASVNCHLHDNHNRTGDGNALLDTVLKRCALTRAYPSNGIVRTIENYSHNRFGFFYDFEPK